MQLNCLHGETKICDNLCNNLSEFVDKKTLTLALT